MTTKRENGPSFAAGERKRSKAGKTTSNAKDAAGAILCVLVDGPPELTEAEIAYAYCENEFYSGWGCGVEGCPTCDGGRLVYRRFPDGSARVVRVNPAPVSG